MRSVTVKQQPGRADARASDAAQDVTDAANAAFGELADELDAITVSLLPPPPAQSTTAAEADHSACWDAHRGTQGTRPPPPLPAPMLRRQAQQLIGRRREVDWVASSLRRHGTTIVWGAPGEGKTSVAMEAACQLQEAGELLFAVVIDMKGKRDRTHVRNAYGLESFRSAHSCAAYLR